MYSLCWEGRRVMKMSWNSIVIMLHNFVNILRNIALYTLKIAIN